MRRHDVREGSVLNGGEREEAVRSLILTLAGRGYHLTPGALRLITGGAYSARDLLAALEVKGDEFPPVLDEDSIKRILDEAEATHVSESRVKATGRSTRVVGAGGAVGAERWGIEEGRGSTAARSAQVGEWARVELDPVLSVRRGVPEEFVEYFQDRFRRLLGIVRKRFQNSLYTPSQVRLRAGRLSRAHVAGLVTEKRSTRRGFVIVLEDESDQIRVFIPREEGDLYRAAESVMMDQLIVVSGEVDPKRGTLRTDAIHHPDVPREFTPNRSGSRKRAVLISDVHVGSSYFLEDLWRRFVGWLKSEDAKDVEYLLICGDLVDGVGIYPDQEDELEIKDIYGQYEEAARLLSMLPSHIRIVYIPGNHEPVRQAEPQPKVPERFLRPLIDSVNHFLAAGNPAVVNLEGVRILLYHGRSLNTVFKYVPGLQPPTGRTVVSAMRQLLRARHLAPMYGEHPIAPESRDWLVIEEVPEVVHMGHVHIFGVGVYRGVRLINSGTFQAETPYIKKMGITATPGIYPILSLHDLSVRPLDLRSPTPA
ncbi:MAG: DNA-directed DNA polymerase II small subunit [Candidatus Korarchaeota archaeon]|nr:DNA-directed DNA polymerase II small subunit [Candidatus Korarchaeota archaeon]